MKYQIVKKIWRTLVKEFKLFSDLEKILKEFKKTYLLYEYTTEWLAKKEFWFTVVDGINYPTIDTIKSLHDFLVLKYERDIDKIHVGEYSLAPLNFPGIKYWMEKNPDPQEDIIIRGAHIFNKFLEEGHPFVDGNKRTGWATLWIFLAANGLLFSFPVYFKEGEQVKKVEHWANYKEESENIKEIVQWIKRYIRKK